MSYATCHMILFQASLGFVKQWPPDLTGGHRSDGAREAVAPCTPAVDRAMRYGALGLVIRATGAEHNYEEDIIYAYTLGRPQFTYFVNGETS